MGDDLSPDDVVALVEQIARNEDPYRLPNELVEEDPQQRPGHPPAATETAISESLYQIVMRMAVGEKIKLALKGNRDARNILIRDGNRIVPRFVLQNPRITDEEIVAMARNRNTDADLLRVIGEHKEWSRSLQVRAALVSNPKAPVAIALRFVNSLSYRELRLLAKSKNVPSAVTGAAKRIVLTRSERGH